MKEETVIKIKNFLELESCEIFSLDESEQIKEMCVAKLCEVLGIACVYNYKNQIRDIQLTYNYSIDNNTKNLINEFLATAKSAEVSE